MHLCECCLAVLFLVPTQERGNEKSPNCDKPKPCSGQWYWLNDWRKEQTRNNRRITYREVIDRLYELMTTKGRLPRIPSTRFNNFITDFLADPENEGATRQEAIDEWERLKKMPVQKSYQEYKKFRNETA